MSRMIMAMGLVLCMWAAAVADTSLGFSARTGDTEFDLYLSDMDASARLDMDGFMLELSHTHNVPEPDVRALFTVHHMGPADAFMALEIARLAARPLADIVVIYKKDHGKGWGELAKQMGIKPGSKEFHALKGNASKAKDKAKGKSKDKHGKENHGKGKP